MYARPGAWGGRASATGRAICQIIQFNQNYSDWYKHKCLYINMPLKRRPYEQRDCKYLTSSILIKALATLPPHRRNMPSMFALPARQGFTFTGVCSSFPKSLATFREPCALCQRRISTPAPALGESDLPSNGVWGNAPIGLPGGQSDPARVWRAELGSAMEIPI